MATLSCGKVSFDTIPHKELMQGLARRIVERNEAVSRKRRQKPPEAYSHCAPLRLYCVLLVDTPLPYLPFSSRLKANSYLHEGFIGYKGRRLLSILNKKKLERVLGASHQTGWTGLVAPQLDLFGRVDAKTLLESERGRVMAKAIAEQVGGEPMRK